jgi:mRNA-degrading endonuclease RelE of RelBE toxin-antitoxin system
MQVLFSKIFEKSLRKLSKRDLEKIFSIIRLLESSSFPLSSNNIKPLHGHQKAYRIRKGNIRLVFVVENQTAYIKEVGYRKDIYEGL